MNAGTIVINVYYLLLLKLSKLAVYFIRLSMQHLLIFLPVMPMKKPDQLLWIPQYYQHTEKLSEMTECPNQYSWKMSLMQLLPSQLSKVMARHMFAVILHSS
jgi:hypothetical protein